MDYLKPRLALLALVFAMLAGAGPAEASITVSTTSDELSPTGNAPDTNCSLREAIVLIDGDDTAARGCTDTADGAPDKIILPALGSPYTLTIPPTGNTDDGKSGDLDVYHDMTITGAGSGSTVIDGNGIDRVFDIFRFDANPPHDQDPTVTISGVTIENGLAGTAGGELNGGGIEVFDQYSALTLANDVITANHAGNSSTTRGGAGGGIYTMGALTVTGSSIDHNTAGTNGGNGGNGGDGGGIDSLAPGTLSIDSSTVSANHAGDGGYHGGQGGGISADSATITASTIATNIAGAQLGAGPPGGNGGNGGGIFIADTLTLTNSTITGNHAGDAELNYAGTAGGVYVVNGPATLTNDTIAANAVGSGPTTFRFAGGYSAGTGTTQTRSRTRSSPPTSRVATARPSASSMPATICSSAITPAGSLARPSPPAIPASARWPITAARRRRCRSGPRAPPSTRSLRRAPAARRPMSVGSRAPTAERATSAHSSSRRPPGFPIRGSARRSSTSQATRPPSRSRLPAPRAGPPPAFSARS